MERLAEKLRMVFWIFTALIIVSSLVVFWRCYFVLFSHERTDVWDYGYEELAGVVMNNPDRTFVIDQGRRNPSYILMAFFLKYSPDDLQKQVDSSIRENYYRGVEFDPYYKFANIETRQIYWEEDVYKDLVLVGDELAVSDAQAKEHNLIRLFEIKDPLDKTVFIGYQTRPELKCSSINNKNEHCQKK